jgi:5-methylphenazine-1-carboxylate 1-monooxygenase
LIEQTTEIYEHPEIDRDALPKLSFGRVTLLGDAAHPMRPVGSQAGTQAIIDARVLAKALAASPLGRCGCIRAGCRTVSAKVRASSNLPISA